MIEKHWWEYKTCTAICLSVLILAGLLAADPASAKQVYFYRDRKGIIHFTDAPTEPYFRPFKSSAVLNIGVSRSTSRLDIKSIEHLITAAARKYRLDPALIKAVIKVESAFDPNAVSWAGAQGLMQLMPGTADLMHVTDAFDPGQNINGGSRYLRRLLDRFKDNLPLALAAYNIGPERVDRENKIPNVKETRNYVKLVTHHYEKFKKKK